MVIKRIEYASVKIFLLAFLKYYLFPCASWIRKIGTGSKDIDWLFSISCFVITFR